MSKPTFAQRCLLAEQAVPDAPYRAMLKKLHDEMLGALNRKPLTDEQRRETISNAWNEYLRGEGHDSFGWYLSQATEAAHGIKGDAS